MGMPDAAPGAACPGIVICTGTCGSSSKSLGAGGSHCVTRVTGLKKYGRGCAGTICHGIGGWPYGFMVVRRSRARLSLQRCANVVSRRRWAVGGLPRRPRFAHSESFSRAERSVRERALAAPVDRSQLPAPCAARAAQRSQAKNQSTRKISVRRPVVAHTDRALARKGTGRGFLFFHNKPRVIRVRYRAAANVTATVGSRGSDRRFRPPNFGVGGGASTSESAAPSKSTANGLSPSRFNRDIQ